MAKAIGLDADTISPDEARRIFPHMSGEVMGRAALQSAMRRAQLGLAANPSARSTRKD